MQHAALRNSILRRVVRNPAALSVRHVSTAKHSTPFSAYKPIAALGQPTRKQLRQLKRIQSRCYNTEEAPKGISYDQLTCSCVKETLERERRVALTPANVALLLKEGFKGVVVEKGCGTAAGFPDADYEAAGAKVVPRAEALKANIVFKVCTEFSTSTLARFPALQRQCCARSPGCHFCHPAPLRFVSPHPRILTG